MGDATSSRLGTSSIAAAAVLIATLGIASRILGLLRDRALASTYGAGPVLDAYQAAFRIPDFVYNLLGLAALSAAFLPTFVRLRSVSLDRAVRFAAKVLTLVGLALAMLAALGVVFASPLYRVLAPGFPPEQQALTAAFGRVLFPAMLFLGCSAVVGGVLQAEMRFLAFAAAPIAYNLGIIIGILVLAPVVGPIGIAWGVVIGAAAHFAIQWIAARRVGFRWSFSPPPVSGGVTRPAKPNGRSGRGGGTVAALFGLRDPDVRATAKQLLPRALALGASQVQLVVIAGIATTLIPGTLAAFSFAVNIQSVPIALIGVAFALAAFPRLAAARTASDASAFRQHFSSAFREILLLALPATVGLITLKAQGVRVLLGAGAFDWDDTVRTLSALEAFGYGLPFAMLVPLLTRSFYAMDDTRTPFIVSVLADVVGIAAALVLGARIGARGLALAVSIAAIVQGALLLISLRVRAGPLDDQRLAGAVGRFALAAFAMAIAIQLAKPIVAGWTGTDTFLGIGLQGTIAGTFGLLVYLGVGMLLKSEEITALSHALHRRALRLVRLPLTLLGADEARG